MFPAQRWTVSVMTLLVSIHAFPQDRAFSVRDDIAMVRFNDLAAQAPGSRSDTANRSPDGRHFAVVTTRGLLDEDLVESDINVFARKELESFLSDSSIHVQPRSKIVARIKSYPHHQEASGYAPVIKDVRWSPNGSQLFFRAENMEGNYQLYEAGIEGGRSHALTPVDRSVEQFDVGRYSIVYTYSKPQKGEQERLQQNPDAVDITGRDLYDVLFPGRMQALRPESYSMGVLKQQHGHWQNRPVPQYSFRDVPYLNPLFPFVLSPQGNKIITLSPSTVVPGSWKAYEPAPSFEHFRFGRQDSLRVAPNNPNRPRQYAVVDLSTGKIDFLLDAPNGRSLAYIDPNRAAWSSDGTRAVVTNTFLPLPEGSSSTSTRAPCPVASIDLPARVVQCLLMPQDKSAKEHIQVLDAAFGKDKNEVVLVTRSVSIGTELRLYRLVNRVWALTSVNELKGLGLNLSETLAKRNAVQFSLRVFVKESLNTPPALWAEDMAAGTSRQIWDPNPQFSHLLFGEAAEYRWKDKSDYEWTGALVKPVGFTPGKKYPFVLQMYSYHRGEFLTDGTSPTAFAARQLASAGFVVLQIPKRPDTLSDADPQDALEGYRSAIAALSKDGLIDPKRGGVVGFSWTYWYATSAIVRDPSLFAAASVADGLDNSYLQYLLTANNGYGIRQQMEKVYGSAPIGKGLTLWLEKAPDFHFDQIQTPVRIEAIDPWSLLGAWDLYASLRLQEKPVDLIYFPKGTHIHQRPMERLESQQGDVDWFRFWLQGYEDPDPSKQGQYRRWAVMKQLRDSAQKGVVTPATGQK
jgi:dipeptidyl aminopeptidase/acylaminoacyl peptidase